MESDDYVVMYVYKRRRYVVKYLRQQEATIVSLYVYVDKRSQEKMP